MRVATDLLLIAAGCLVGLVLDVYVGVWTRFVTMPAVLTAALVLAVRR